MFYRFGHPADGQADWGQFAHVKRANSGIIQPAGALFGEVAEWLKAAVSKTAIVVRLSRVRISPSPPLFFVQLPASELRFGGSRLKAAVQGPVAQLGERVVRNDEVSGSIPLRSTILENSPALPGYFRL